MLVFQKIVMIINLLIGSIGIVINIRYFSQKSFEQLFSERNMLLLITLSFLVWIINPEFQILYVMMHTLIILVLQILISRVKNLKDIKVYIILFIVILITLSYLYIINPI